MKLTKGPRRFYEFLKTQQVGAELKLKDILESAQWTESSFRTYLGKNILRPFLSETEKGKWRVLKEGSTLSEESVAAAFTQAREKKVVLSKGDLLPGVKGGLYTLVDRLGEGAVGHVWKGTSKTGEPVAVKVMVPRLDLLNPTTIDNVTERFRRESKNGQRLSHVNVVKYLDRGEWSGAPFLVMKLADQSGADALKSGKFSIKRSAEVIASCAEGLGYLHAQKCVHRDVKPPNILLADGVWLLGDLGIVKWNDMNPAFTGAGTITRASVQLGSWYYMAPEQLASPHEAEAASDVYALGVTWYEFLTATTPSPAQFAAKKQPSPSSDLEVNSLIARMVSYDRLERPSLAEVLMVAAKKKSGSK